MYALCAFSCWIAQNEHTTVFNDNAKRKDTMIKSMGSRRFGTAGYRVSNCCCYCRCRMSFWPRSSHASLSSSMLFLLFPIRRRRRRWCWCWCWRPLWAFIGICVSVSQCPNMYISDVRVCARVCVCVWISVCVYIAADTYKEIKPNSQRVQCAPNHAGFRSVGRSVYILATLWQHWLCSFW